MTAEELGDSFQLAIYEMGTFAATNLNYRLINEPTSLLCSLLSRVAINQDPRTVRHVHSLSLFKLPCKSCSLEQSEQLFIVSQVTSFQPKLICSVGLKP